MDSLRCGAVSLAMFECPSASCPVTIRRPRRAPALSNTLSIPLCTKRLSRVSSTHRSALAPGLVDLAVRLEGAALRIQAHVPVLADLAENVRPLVSPHQGTELPVPHPRNPVVIQVVRIAGIFRFSPVRVVDVAIDGRRDAVPREAAQTFGDRIFPASLRHDVDAQ